MALKRMGVGDRIFDTCNYLFLLLFSVTVIYPFWSQLLISFSGPGEAYSLGFRLWLSEWSTDAYAFAFTRYGNVGIAYRNSIARTVIGTVAVMAVSLLGAYPLSKKDLPGRNIMTLYLLITMFFGGGLIPTYLLIRGIGLLDDFWVLILPTMTSAFNIIIVRNFLMTIDKSLEESAFLDGASFYQILPKIILPLSKPVMAVIALWAAVQHWNAWFDALIYLPSKDKIVLQLLLRRMLQEVNYFQRALRNFEDITQVRLPSQSARAAVTILTIGPIILFYPFLQRYFVKGIFVGSLKG